MAYGTIKVDTITFTDAGVDKSVSISGLVQNPTFSGNITVTGTISGNILRGQTVSGVTVTGTTAAFSTGTFISLTGTTTQGTTATYTSGSFTSLTGVTTSGTTANFVSGVFTTQISGATVTGNVGAFTTLTGGVATLTSGVFAARTASLPSISFASDPNTGIYSPGADQVAISTNGTERLFISSTGRLGLGTAASIAPSAPLDDFHISSTDPAVLLEETDAGTDEKYWRIRAEGSILRFEGINDTFNSTTSWLNVTRSTGARTADNIAFSTSTSERARIDSSGRLLVGTSTTPGQIGSTAPTVIFSETGTQNNLSLAKFRASTSGPGIQLIKSRGASPGTNTIVVSGDELGRVRFAGADGTNYIEAASIDALVDGTPGADDMPGRLVFSTTADGASSPTERMRITNDGVQAYNQTAPAAVNATATLTVADLKTGIITSTSAAATDMTLPTGTDTQAGFSDTYDNFTFQWSVINTGPSLVQVLAATAHTIVGSGSVATGTSGRFASRRTAANTFVTYRLS
jgi:hypothetical protein